MYECHITIEPVFNDRLEHARIIAEFHSFRVADLLFKKREEDSPQRSCYDTFMTGHAELYSDILDRMFQLIGELKANDFKIWRYKIEEIIVDSRYKDIYNIISSNPSSCS